MTIKLAALLLVANGCRRKFFALIRAYVNNKNLSVHCQYHSFFQIFCVRQIFFLFHLFSMQKFFSFASIACYQNLTAVFGWNFSPFALALSVSISCFSRIYGKINIEISDKSFRNNSTILEEFFLFTRLNKNSSKNASGLEWLAWLRSQPRTANEKPQNNWFFQPVQRSFFQLRMF